MNILDAMRCRAHEEINCKSPSCIEIARLRVALARVSCVVKEVVNEQYEIALKGCGKIASEALSLKENTDESDGLIWTLDKQFVDDERWQDEIDFKLAHLIINTVIFTNNGWWYEKDGIPWKKDAISLHVNCNDVFAWASADAEDITHDEIHDLYTMWRRDIVWGSAAWCIKKRKLMPQSPVEKAIRDAGIWNLEELLGTK